MACYCEERKNNKGVAELMKDLPEGFCGTCDICGKPGHTKGHPSLPTTGAWCDEHWSQLVSGQSITLDKIILILIIISAIAAGVIALFKIIK